VSIENETALLWMGGGEMGRWGGGEVGGENHRIKYFYSPRILMELQIHDFSLMSTFYVKKDVYKA